MNGSVKKGVVGLVLIVLVGCTVYNTVAIRNMRADLVGRLADGREQAREAANDHEMMFASLVNCLYRDPKAPAATVTSDLATPTQTDNFFGSTPTKKNIIQDKTKRVCAIAK